MPNQFSSPEGDLENYFLTEYWILDQYIGDKLYSWGNNVNGQLGLNTLKDTAIPSRESLNATNWKQVSCSYRTTAAVKTDGTLWLWGNNLYGQLGDNTVVNRSTPVTTFAGGNDWRSVSLGLYNSAAIKTDGSLWTWGNNALGELGTNDTDHRSTPVTTFAGGGDWKQVSCGWYFTAAIKTDGTLWTWGNNGDGQLGDNTVVDKLTPVTTFAGGINWKSLSCGGYYTTAIKTDGTLWLWGQNGGSGKLGTNDVANKLTPVTTFAGGTSWKQVSAGWLNTGAVKSNGTLWMWGSGSDGILGTNDTTNRSTPITTFAGGTNWKQVSCGWNGTAAVKTDGTLWTWGNAQYGNLGNNITSATRSTPVTTFAGGRDWKQVSAGDYHMVAITAGLSADVPFS